MMMRAPLFRADGVECDIAAHFDDIFRFAICGDAYLSF